MGYLIDSARAMAVTMRNVFRPATTVQYPAEDRVRPERYRTSFALVHNENGEEACIACLACERICPSGIITQVCPTDAIIMLRELAKPSLSREGLFLSMERLYENESLAHSWGTGTRLMEMQNPKRGLPAPEAKKKTPLPNVDPIPEGSS